MIKKPSLDELISLLEKKFGKLIPNAIFCVSDIYENYDDFIKALTERINYNRSTLNLVGSTKQSKNQPIEISPNLLVKKLPSLLSPYYLIIKAIYRLMIVIGIIFLFFIWEVSLVIFIISLILKYFYQKMEIYACNQLIFEIITKAKYAKHEFIFDICQYYISGILRIHPLTSNGISVSFPLRPSASLYGEEVV